MNTIFFTFLMFPLRQLYMCTLYMLWRFWKMAYYVINIKTYSLCVYVYLMILMNKVSLRGYHDENVDDDEMNKIAQ